MQIVFPGELFCHTLHIMDSHGGSVIVHKKCAGPEECSPATVGCLDIDSQRVSQITEREQPLAAAAYR